MAPVSQTEDATLWTDGRPIGLTASHPSTRMRKGMHRELVLRAQRGDQVAFERLLELIDELDKLA